MKIEKTEMEYKTESMKFLIDHIRFDLDEIINCNIAENEKKTRLINVQTMINEIAERLK